jgi:hypothetical protein
MSDLGFNSSNRKFGTLERLPEELFSTSACVRFAIQKQAQFWLMTLYRADRPPSDAS